ncbi:hypothetical protein FB451DRAFT_1513481 [Mycena latifolia]|nr:hypothetical protein FB451DRAFT_1513481 [Mycena latifolia]
MPSSPVVSVFGATGLQGLGVVETLLEDGTFIPRAISRNPGSDASLKLKARGVEVVKGDSGNKASLVETLRSSEAVFAVREPVLNRGGEVTASPFMEKTVETPDELTQGKNIVDTAKEVGVKFFIFRRSEKAEVEEYLKFSGLANASIQLGDSTWHSCGLLKKKSTGFDISIPNYSATDLQAFTWIGRDVPSVILALLKNYTNAGKNISGKSYPVVTATMPYTELAAMTAKVLGVEVTFSSGLGWRTPAMDEMYAAQAEHDGVFTATPVLNPDLVALGVKFSTVQDFLETEVLRSHSSFLMLFQIQSLVFVNIWSAGFRELDRALQLNHLYIGVSVEE